MASIRSSVFCFLLLAALRLHAQLIQNARDQLISELESIYFDGGPISFFAGIKPCTLYFDPSINEVRNDTGRQTSAGWIRTAFRKSDSWIYDYRLGLERIVQYSSRSDRVPDDFVTADVAKGIGGLDASIGYETHRPENVGVAFNDSLFFFQFFYSERTSSEY